MDKKVTHCPQCQKPAMNGGQFMGTAQFKIKCPWCQAILQITVQPKITAELASREPASPIPNNFNSFSNNDLESGSEEDFDNYKDATYTSIPSSGMKVVGYLYPDKQPDNKN